MAPPPTVCPQCALEYAGGEVFCPNDGARLAPKQGHAPSGRASHSDPLLGQLLSGRYRILRKIGEGGMGIVYEAEHVVIEKRVGLKVLREDFSSRPDVVERFRQEAKSASRIGHEHIIDISDFGETAAGASFFVMELLHGHDLAEELGQKGALSPERTIQICLQCARALGAAHAKGIVHRDMKPENIFLVQRESGEDFVKIVDFGIAKMNDVETTGQPGRKLTKTGMIFGTPEYMSPEQAGGKALDHRVDVYALGVIMYELLSGRVPFLGDTFMGVLTQHMFEPPPPLKVVRAPGGPAPELEQIVSRALAKHPDERFQSMEEFAAALTAALHEAPRPVSSAPPPGTVTHPGYLKSASGHAPVPRVILPAQASEFPSSPQGTAAPGRFFALGAALTIALAATLWLLLRHEPSAQEAAAQQPAVTAEQKVPRLPSVEAPEAPETPDEPAEAAKPSESAPVRVLVHVETEPRGAVVSVGGQAVCQPTPCNFSTERDQLVRLDVAKQGFRPSSTELKPTNDDTRVQITLQRRNAPSRSAPPPEDELKVPDAFAPRRR